MKPIRDDDESAEVQYHRLFAVLAERADELDIPLDEEGQLIDDVLLSTLVKQNIPDMRTWIAAAFTYAVSHRGGRVF